MALTVFSPDALAAEAPTSGSCGEKITWSLENGTLSIVGTGAMMETSSTSGDPPWYRSKTSVERVIISDGVTSIIRNAFGGCKNLTSITIPDSVSQIGDNAFNGCSSLESITIPAQMTYIGSHAFAGLTGLTSITIPETVNTIGGFVFMGCTNLTSVSIPESVTEIQDGAFQDCKALKSLTLPSGIKRIRGNLFNGCVSLTDMNIPKGVTAIEESAFAGCKLLANVEVPETVTSIESSAFQNCSNLKSITIPNSAKAINYRSFYNCSSLTDVTIPNSVLSIGGGAFYGCKGLTGITIPDSVTSIGIDAFRNCSGMTSLTLPNRSVTLSANAFSGCDGLTSLTIPGGMRSVGASAFSSCSGLTSVTLEPGVSFIYDEAFKSCSKLKSVSIPDTLTYIGASAFNGCASLAGELNLPEGVTSIGESAFSGCRSLTGNVTIPAGVKGKLGNSAFRDCMGLESVTIQEGVTAIGEWTFNNCSSLTAVTIPGSVSAIGKRAFAGCASLTDVTIQHGVTSIGSDAFASCSSLAVVTIPVSVSTMAADAFPSYSSLADIYYGGSPAEWTALIEKNSFTPPEKVKIHFSTGEVIFTVVFNPQSGSVDPRSKTVTVGDAYGELPTPTRRNFLFEGWFTAAKEGERVTGETTVSIDDGTTLYAHWIDPSNLSWLEKLTYRFGNSARDFGYASNYKIPYDRYVRIFGNTPRAWQLFNASEAWGGSCFGMSSTSAMFSQKDSGVSVAAFRNSAIRPYDLTTTDPNAPWNLTLCEFIETMHISQKCQRIQERYKYGCSIDEWCQEVTAFQQSGKNPPVVGIWGGDGGHALVAYDLVDISPTESRLMVYDPNFPNTERYIRLDKSNGAYTGWYYHLNDSKHWGTGYAGAWIACVPYSDFHETWTGKPIPYSLPGRAAAAGSEENALLIFNSDNAAIYDLKGREVAVIKDGKLQTSHADIFQMVETDTETGGSGDGNTILFLPSDQYTVERKTGSGTPFTATMVHVDQSAAVTTSGGSVTFAVDDSCGLNYAKVNGDAGSGTYTITLESSLLEKPEASSEPFYTVTASGSLGAEGASAAQSGEELFVENVPSGAVQVNGSPASADSLRDGGELNISAALNSNLTAALQSDGSVLLSRSPAGAAHAYAARYDSSGRMTDFTAGRLEGGTIRFSKPVAEDAQLFLLDDTYAPVSGKLPILK